MSSRLLLRQILCGSLLTTYLDHAVFDEDRQEALQALAVTIISVHVTSWSYSQLCNHKKGSLS